MLIWGFLVLIGVGLVTLGFVGLLMGLTRQKWGWLAISIFVPVLYWYGLNMLWKADQRFILEETAKNGGKLPDWVW
jgi:hypothetical protein